MADIWLGGDFKEFAFERRAGGTFTNESPWKLLLHTIEGSVEGALSMYGRGTGCPHFTVSLNRQIFWQHVPLNRSAYALVNLSGGTETNRDNVIQVEIEGWAKYGADHDLNWYISLVFQVIQPILAAVPGIAVNFPEGGFVGSYADAKKVRMSAAEWDSFSGILGHQHAPENTHWDPGALNAELMKSLLVGTSGGSKDMYFEKYSDPEANREYIVSQKRDGKIIYREFSKPRGDGYPMKGLAIVLNEWRRKSYVQKVNP